MQIISDGKSQLEISSVDIVECLRKWELLFSELLQNKKIKIKKSGPSQLWVKGEASIITNEILNNILSNSIKFSHPGTSISFEFEEKNGLALIKIIDEGVGIPKQRLDHIFDSGRSTSSLGTQGELGTGYGMGLIKLYIEILGGKLEISSRYIDEYPESHGTTILMTLERSDKLEKKQVA